MAEPILVLTNTPSSAEAQAIAGAAVAAHLAAAVQVIGPVASAYRWQGRVEQAEEWICLLKTSRELYPEVERLIQANHSYQLPGILAVPIIAGSEPYLAWYQSQLKSAGD
jgi:periplasmic divalent cation tolerance protein